MDTSVVTKTRKKQSETPPASSGVHHLEPALLSLENACMRVLDGEFAESRDTERQYGQQRLMNIAKPVSLALAECNGLRRFHYHYRHRADDETILHPVLEPSPIDTLAQVCEQALKACRNQLVGIQDTSVLKARNMLETALSGFLVRVRDK